MAELTPDELRTHLAKTRLLVLDVDGVLTDGRVTYEPGSSESEIELQSFYVRDGLGINLLGKDGVIIAWISGRGCAATRRRAQELGVQELHLHARGGKGPILADIQKRHSITPAETVVMGDDIVDLAMAQGAAILACPSDAHDELLERAHFIATKAGGRGAVRELCEAILRARGSWEKAIGGFLA